MKLTDENYWNQSYENLEFKDINDGALIDFLDKFVNKVDNKSSIEIGSFPGNFIPIIGRKGYKVHGIDYNPKNAIELPNWLRSLNLDVGQFWSSDFFYFINNSTTRFDLVCSFGFIEHFLNYEEVLKAHFNLINPKGKLIVTTPNFRGWLQYIPHRFFDNKNLKKHCLKSMNPGRWKSILEANGFEVIYSGYFGGYLFWVDPNQKRSKINAFFLKQIHRFIFNLNKMIKRNNIESSAFSAFCGIVAIKK